MNQILQDILLSLIKKQELTRSCKMTVKARSGKIEQDPCFVRSSKIEQDLARFSKIWHDDLCKIKQDLAKSMFCKIKQDPCFFRLSKIKQDPCFVGVQVLIRASCSIFPTIDRLLNLTRACK
jgi:hypothetical protein